MKWLYGSLVFCMLSNCSFSQDLYRNSVFIEVGGNAIAYSVNFERCFPKNFRGRVGIGYIDNSYIVPFTIGNTLLGGPHHIEISAGFTYVNHRYNTVDDVDTRSNQIFVTGFVGYRLQKPKSRFVFRAGITPFYNIYDEGTLAESAKGSTLFWGGMSFGYRFYKISL